MVYDATDGLADLFANERVTAYIGFDPTASSLHVGSLLTVMGLARLQRFGHTPIAIVGGGTGMIGDPSGKSQERVLLSPTRSTRTSPASGGSSNGFSISTARANPARIVNNADWLGTIDLLSFLRDAGKHFTVNYMLQKESVSRRLESEDGISFTEFSYLLLQAYDFLQLFDRYGCTLQMGGSDQWGNITAGIDLIRKLRAKKAHGLVLAADDDGVGREVRQDRSGHDLARSGAHLAVQVLSVLAEHGRSRRRPVPEVLHVPGTIGHRLSRGRDRSQRRKNARRSVCWRAR